MRRICCRTIWHCIGAVILAMASLSISQLPLAHADAPPGWWAKPGTEFLTSKNSACSVGFPMTDAAGRHLFVTALHCFIKKDGSLAKPEIYSFTPTHQLTGVVGRLVQWATVSQGKIVDAAIVEVNPGTSLFGGIASVPEGSPAVGFHGTPVCTFGYRESGFRCGNIDHPKTYRKDPKFQALSIAYNANICVLNGDSGGPSWIPGPQGGPLGIVQAGNNSDDHCSLFPHTWFTPLSSIFATFLPLIPALRIV